MGLKMKFLGKGLLLSFLLIVVILLLLFPALFLLPFSGEELKVAVKLRNIDVGASNMGTATMQRKSYRLVRRHLEASRVPRPPPPPPTSASPNGW